jgi:hypothetical protein
MGGDSHGQLCSDRSITPSSVWRIDLLMCYLVLCQSVHCCIHLAHSMTLVIFGDIATIIARTYHSNYE